MLDIRAQVDVGVYRNVLVSVYLKRFSYTGSYKTKPCLV